MSKKPVYVFAKWRVKEGQLETVLNLLSSVANKSIEEEGNLFYRVHQSKADLYTLLLYEGYKNEKALTEHRDSEHFQSLVVGKIVPLLEEREVILTTPLALGSSVDSTVI